jgi:hypothetical protein
MLLQSAAVSAQVTPATAEPVRAIWRTQHVDFRFRSERQHFKCEEFAARLQRILTAVGAHLDARTRLHCADAFTGNVSGRIVITGPIEATDENVDRALTEITSVDKLSARLNRRPDPATRIRVFPAEWRTVSMRQARLDAGDCDLLRAVKLQLLPALSVQDVQLSDSCSGRGAPRFSASALVRIEGAVDGDTRKPAMTVDAACEHDRADEPCDGQQEEERESESEVLPAG